MKTKNIILTCMFCLGFIKVFSQGENDNWHFSAGAGINFSGTSPVIINNSQISGFEAVGTASDSNGELLFYTNGADIWNRQNQIMQNGSGLLGHNSNQQLQIVKYPNNPGKYFVFTTGITISTPVINNYIAYSIVDMSLGANGTGQPLGAVMPAFKNIPILDNNGNTFKSEAITAIPHTNGVGFWVVIPYGTKLFSYLVDDQGFHPTPVVSNINFPVNLQTGYYFNIKASPKLNNPAFNFSNFICINTWNGTAGIKTYSFNATTGQITNQYVLDMSSQLSTYSAEFSKDGSILYLGRHENNTAVYAVNLVASTTSLVYNQIFSQNDLTCAAIQRNKYDDIYISFRNQPYLSKINNPNVFGGSSVNVNEIFLNGRTTQMGLPQLIPGIQHSPPNPNQCLTNILLTTEELNTVYTHQASNTIITQDDYLIKPRKDITMIAGKSITFNPNTHIMYGAKLLAKIENCEGVIPEVNKKSEQKVYIKFELDKDVPRDNVNIFPNPASDFVNINSKLKIKSWEVYDLSGKQISKGNSSKINVKDFIKGIYMINILFENGKNISKKVSVK